MALLCGMCAVPIIAGANGKRSFCAACVIERKRARKRRDYHAETASQREKRRAAARRRRKTDAYRTKNRAYQAAKRNDPQYRAKMCARQHEYTHRSPENYQKSLARAAQARAKNRDRYNAKSRERIAKIYDLLTTLRTVSPELLKEFGL